MAGGGSQPLPPAAPSPTVATPPVRRVTVATDGSPDADRAVGFAIDLAKRYEAQLTILSVAPLVPLYLTGPGPWVPGEVPEGEVQHYRGVVDLAVKRAETEGLSAVTGVCLEGIVVDEILGHLEAHPADLLVLGSRGLSTAKRLLLGSVSDAVSHHVKVPVLITKGPPDPP